MPIFAVHYTYSDATVPGRDEIRPVHREYLAGLATEGTLLARGPYPDGSGALLIFDAADADTVGKLLAADPFQAANLVDETRVVEWLPTDGFPSK
ncbi:YciI family protein [Nocardia sp. NBC_01503]|uniref:YciI family protein n=1 Tax=Nocardia sp. NBC_01503 TaxID=2975997 RepID=UPI002E7BC7F8|nr:YciI family protein [Nocardia sp. NBC_01503]WTL29795.1 YciI family protein [Nocardia sp. NBC_01503]